jgi:tetratricopeptide (TPR) repeat protein
MTATKKLWNSIFALISIVLLTLVVAFAIKSQQSVPRPSGQDKTSEASAPENNPPPDLSQELLVLTQRSARDPQNADIHTQIGNIYYDQREYEKAIESYQKSLSIQPNNPNVETDMATCYHYLGKPDEALKLFDHVLQYSPGFAQALYNKGIVLIHDKNDIEGGLRAWEEELKSETDPARRAQLQQSIDQLKSSVK